MQFNVEVEKTSDIVRKLTVTVPAAEVKSRIEKGLLEVQRTAKLKGFRPGFAPISIIRKEYGADVRHDVFHRLIDESFQRAVNDQKIKAVGYPKIDTPNHKTGEGSHDHTLHENEDLTYIATVEVMPELKIKNYTGVAVNQEIVDVTEEQVNQVIQNLLNSQAQLTPAAEGQAVKQGDFVDVQFTGGVVTAEGVQARDDMKGNRFLEVGSNVFIPGFEDNLVGLKAGDKKTFRITFPKEYQQAELAGQEAEFSVTINEHKEKKLPELDDELVKQMGYESVPDLRTKAKEYLEREKTAESDRKVKNQLLSTLIEKNTFELPKSLVEAQTRALAEDWAREMKSQGVDQKTIQDAIMQELEQIQKRAEIQVRGSLILEAISEQEEIRVSAEELDKEIANTAAQAKVGEAQLREYYAKNPGKKEDLEFRLRQDRTLKLLLDKAKVKRVAASAATAE